MTTIAFARYRRLIEAAQARAIIDGYGERHHIVPRSEGGADESDNLVWLTPREHFLAHWLLYRIYRTPASAKAFRLMANDQNKRRGRDYAKARELMAASMMGGNNVAKRPEVRAKLKANAHSPFLGKKRPDHALKMRQAGVWCKEKNPRYGTGYIQQGSDNHMSRKVVGVHIFYGAAAWDTLKQAADTLGVSKQAISQAIKRKARTKGWKMEHAS